MFPLIFINLCPPKLEWQKVGLHVPCAQRMLTARPGCSQASLDSAPLGRAQASASCCSTERDPYKADRGFLASRSQVPLGLLGATLRPHSCSRPKVKANPLFLKQGKQLGIQGEGNVPEVPEVGLQDALHLEETGSAVAGQPLRLGIKTFYPGSQGPLGSWEKESDGVKEPRALILF